MQFITNHRHLPLLVLSHYSTKQEVSRRKREKNQTTAEQEEKKRGRNRAVEEAHEFKSLKKTMVGWFRACLTTIFLNTFYSSKKKKENMFDNLKIEDSFIILKTKNSLFSKNIFLVIFIYLLIFLK